MPERRRLCYLCEDGNTTRVPHLAGRLDIEVQSIPEQVNVTATFVPRSDGHGRDVRARDL